MYSGNAFETTDYAIGVATAPDPLGPFTRVPRSPIQRTNRETGVFGPGHPSVAAGACGDRLVFCHTRVSAERGGEPLVRYGSLDFDEQGRVVVADGAEREATRSVDAGPVTARGGVGRYRPPSFWGPWPGRGRSRSAGRNPARMMKTGGRPPEAANPAFPPAQPAPGITAPRLCPREGPPAWCYFRLTGNSPNGMDNGAAGRRPPLVVDEFLEQIAGTSAGGRASVIRVRSAHRRHRVIGGMRPVPCRELAALVVTIGSS